MQKRLPENIQVYYNEGEDCEIRSRLGLLSDGERLQREIIRSRRSRNSNNYTAFVFGRIFAAREDEAYNH